MRQKLSVGHKYDIIMLRRSPEYKDMSRDSHVRKNFLPTPPNDLKFSDLVEKITEIISILVSKFYDNHKRR